jgi:hypothetical protein
MTTFYIIGHDHLINVFNDSLFMTFFIGGMTTFKTHGSNSVVKWSKN